MEMFDLSTTDEIVLVAILLLAYYFLYASQTPEIFACRKLEAFLDFNVKCLRQKYYPSPLFIEGRLQTIFAYYRRKTTPNELPYEREIFEFADGGQIALDFMNAHEDQPKSERPLLVVFFPGLSSWSQTSYVRTLVMQFIQAGASTAVVCNNRGNAGIPFMSTKTYSAANYEDFEEVIDYLKGRFPDHRMIGVGTSLGGMILSKYLICKSKDAKEKLESAILISVPWDWYQGNKNFEKPFVNKYIINRFMTRHLVGVVKKIIDKFKGVELKFDPDAVMRAYTVREFDAALTVPNFDYSDVDTYYNIASSAGRTHHYSIPVFALSAEDDPLQPGYLLPREEALRKGSKLALITTSRGGHLGWIEGFMQREVHFMERIVGELIYAIRKYGAEELAGI